MTLVSDYNYDLPEELIAQVPAETRTESRMLAVNRDSGACNIHAFKDLLDFLRPGDCLVLNDTKVIPARLHGKKVDSGGQVEALLLEDESPTVWKAMLRPGRRLRPGTVVQLEDSDVCFKVLEKVGNAFTIEFKTDDVLALLDRVGHMPLPPYISREDASADRLRYQTVFASNPGAVAAPTAGLHFNDDILAKIEAMGVSVAHVTLHVGAGTFQPVKAENIADHEMHFERYTVSPESAETINTARAKDGRVVAVGTTSVRTLESTFENGKIVPGQGRTNLFMYPPYKPKAVDILLTNFHLPKSTLLMLVSCFCSREIILDAYQKAIDERMRFFSYGDCMLLYR